MNGAGVIFQHDGAWVDEFDAGVLPNLFDRSGPSSGLPDGGGGWSRAAKAHPEVVRSVPERPTCWARVVLALQSRVGVHSPCLAGAGLSKIGRAHV